MGEEAFAGRVNKEDGGGGVQELLVVRGVCGALHVVRVEFIEDIGNVAVDWHVVPARGVGGKARESLGRFRFELHGQGGGGSAGGGGARFGGR